MSEIMGWGYKVIERSGRMLKELLLKSNLFSSEHCGREDCQACSHARKPMDCRRRGFLYESTCVSCRDGEGRDGALYIGESARSPNKRFDEHIGDARAKKKSSHIWKHWPIYN